MESNIPIGCDTTNSNSLSNDPIGLLYGDGWVLNSNGIMVSTDTYLNAVTPHPFNSNETGCSQHGLRTPVYALDSNNDNEEPTGKNYSF